MATIGKIDPFDDAEEDWSSYVERLEMFFMVNSVEDEKRTAALVSLIGGKTYGLLKSLTAPEAPSSFTFVQLTDLLRNHFNPKPLVIAERFRFYKSNQLEETVSQYAADLRRLARHCEFGTFLPDALRDRFVCGLANVHIQKKLLAEDKLTFDKAVAIAVAMETATKDAAELQDRKLSGAASQPVYNVQQKPVGKSSGTVQRLSCYRCGGNHAADKCSFKDAQCYNCSKKGHVSRMCKSKERNAKSNDRRNIRSTHKLDHDGDVQEEEYEEVYYIKSIINEKNHPYKVEIHLNGMMKRIEVDTGAAVSVIDETTYRELIQSQEITLHPSSAKLRTYSGHFIPVKGRIDVKVSYKGQQEHLSALVVQGEGPCLMGRDWLNKSN